MSNKIYSFTKVEKRRTKSGLYALIAGIISLGVLAFFIGFGIYKSGELHGSICLIPYLTMVVSIIGAVVTGKDLARIDVAGKYLYSGYRVCLCSTILHGLIFFIGILKIIL